MKKVIFFLFLACLFPWVSFAKDIKQDESLYYQDFKKFLKITGAEKNQKVLINSMFEQFKKAPNAKKEFFEEAEIMMNDEISALNETLFPVYKKYLTHEDLKEIIKFYETPTGKRLVSSQPLILKDSFQIGVEWGKGVAKRLQEKLSGKK